MAGCECDDFKEALKRRIIIKVYNTTYYAIRNRNEAWLYISHCPFCGARLTPPEAGDD